MFKNDSFIQGLIVGAGVPLVGYAVFQIFIESLGGALGGSLQENYLLLLVGLNALIMRYVLLKKKHNQTGRGIMLVTFIYTIVYFTYYYTNLFS